jgi:hypothetical protein
MIARTTYQELSRRGDLLQVAEGVSHRDHVTVFGVYVVEVCLVGLGLRSPTASRGITGRKPNCNASTAVARTQPEVDAPVMMRVSTPAAVRRLERPVPKKPEANSLFRTGSVPLGAMRGSISAQRVPSPLPG